MSNVQRIIAAVVVGAALIIGVIAYSVFRTPQEASAPITAIPLAQSTAEASGSNADAQTTPEEIATSAPAAAGETPTTAVTEAPTEAATTTTSTAEATESVPTEAPVAATTDATSAPATTSSMVIAQIVQEESEARFIIDEVLNNSPKTVVGATNQVAGEFEVDPSNPANSRIGTIQINARTLTTDSDFRNRAIKNAILLTDQYEFITFTPTGITGLPEQTTDGESYTFQVAGDLTIRDVTRPVTFDVTATPQSTERLEALATTTIRYADYNITIPSARQVASVAEEVRLELEFVAVPKQG